MQYKCLALWRAGSVCFRCNMSLAMEGQSGQKEHFLILINDLLILINDLLILINDLLILINIY